MGTLKMTALKVKPKLTAKNGCSSSARAYAHCSMLQLCAQLYSSTDHVLASHTTFFNFQVHRSDFVHVTTRTSHDDGFIEIGAGFIVHGFSLFPARRFFYNGFSCWIQFNRRTSENHYVFTRTKKTVLQFL